MTVREGVLLRLREALELFEVELSRVGEGDLADRTADLLISVLVELARGNLGGEQASATAAPRLALTPSTSLAR